MNGIGIIAVFLALIVMGIPIAFSMGLAAITYLLIESIPFSVLAQRIPNALNSFPLVAVPVFIFAGNLMNSGGITNRLFDVARKMVGHRKGALAHVNILASLIFSGISGAALADIGGLGNIEIRAMREQGYDNADSAAITAASATLGPIFPPSIPLIILASVAELSGVRLLLAGIVPALLIAAILMITVTIIAHRRDFPRDTEPVTAMIFWRSFREAFPALITPIALVGGLLSGWFSPTEVASVTVAYSLFLGIVVYRELTWRMFWQMCRDTVRSTAIILFVVACASVFAWTLTIEQVPAQISRALLSVSSNPIVMLFMVNVLLLLVGMIVDTIAAILVMTPIIFPVMLTLGVDPIHLGIVMVLNLMVGLLTPPVGMSLYMVSVVAGEPVSKVVHRAAPYIVVLVIALLIVTYVPVLSTFVPTVLYRR